MKSIHTSFAPNVMRRDVQIALRELICDWRRSDKTSLEELERMVKQHFHVPHAFAVNSGREGLYFILKALNFQKDDEVILQPFTCMVVVNALLWNGVKPVYADIDPPTYNIDPAEIEKKINPRTRAILVQHTFGIPADMDKISHIAKKHNLILIEDSAHAMGATYKGKPLGTIGEVGFYSFGRSKVLSCVSGGMILTHHEKLANVINKIVQELSEPSLGEVKRNLLHIIFSPFIKRFYSCFGLGKLLLVLLQKCHLLTMEVLPEEKRAVRPEGFGRRMSHSLAQVARSQFTHLDGMNERRRSIAFTYYHALKSDARFQLIDPAKFPGAIFLRYPIMCRDESDRERIFKKARQTGVILGDWYVVPIAPLGSDTVKAMYTGCPKAEKLCAHVLNLPTHVSLTEGDIARVLALFHA